MKKVIKIVAVVNGTPNHADELASAIRACSKESIQEEGCLEYLSYRDIETSGRFVFVESWKDEEAFSQHMGTEHLKTLKAAFDSVGAKVDMMRLEELNG